MWEILQPGDSSSWMPVCHLDDKQVLPAHNILSALTTTCDTDTFQMAFANDQATNRKAIFAFDALKNGRISQILGQANWYMPDNVFTVQ